MNKFTHKRNLVLALVAGGLLAAWAMGDDVLPWIYDVSGRSVAAPTTSETTVSADLDYRFKIEAWSVDMPFTTRKTKATVLMVR